MPMAEQLGITWTAVAGVVITTIGMYFALIVLVRIAGQRSLTSMSSFDLGCVIALGAVVGRTSLLLKPTLLTGLIALVMVHVYFAIRPEKLDITKSMIYGTMNRDFYLRHYDPERWIVERRAE